MKTNSIGEFFTIKKILKIDFQNFRISWNASESISWTFLGSLHFQTIVKYVFHEIFWKKYFTVCSRLKRTLDDPWKLATEVRSSRPEAFCKKGVLRNFTKFTGKCLCQSLFFNEVAGHLFLQNTSGRLLLRG